MTKNSTIPHDIEAEEVIIGSTMVRPDLVIDVANDLDSEDFYSPKFQAVWSAFRQMWERDGIKPDPVSLAHEASSRGASVLPEDLFSLMTNSIIPNERHVDIIKSTKAARDIMAFCQETLQSVTSGGDPYEIGEEMDHFASSLGGSNSNDPQAQTFWELAESAEASSPWVIPGLLKTDWRAIVIGGEGVGKAVVMRSMAMTAAQGVHVFSHQRIEPQRTLYVDCVDAQTEVMTKTGWSSYKDLEVGDDILTLNAGTQLSEWKPIRDLIVKEHTGDMVRLKQRNLDAYTTASHRWYVNDRYVAGDSLQVVLASDLAGRHRIPLARPLADSTDHGSTLDDDAIALLGWYVTDGHATAGQGITITQSPTANPAKCRMIEGHLANLRIPLSVCAGGGGGANAYYFSGPVARAIRSACPDRSLTPEFVVTLNARQRKILFDSMVLGDGSRSTDSRSAGANGKSFGAKYTRTGFGGVNTRTIEAFEMLACLMGGTPSTRPMALKPSYLKSEERWITPTQPFWWCNVKSGKWTTMAETKVETVPVRGELVWCPNTENGNFLARRNGAVYFTGNCENPAESIIETGEILETTLMNTVDDYDETRFRIWRRPEGIDIRRRSDRADLLREIAFQKPTLLCIGPLYKMYRKQPRENYEDAADDVCAILDDMRTKFGFALVIEHHAPKGSGGHTRELVPMGSQRWMGWPELGYGLRENPDVPTILDVEEFRKPRLRADWPQRINRDRRYLVHGVWDDGRH